MCKENSAEKRTRRKVTTDGTDRTKSPLAWERTLTDKMYIVELHHNLLLPFVAFGALAVFPLFFLPPVFIYMLKTTFAMPK
jgi:hypothetical protein